MSWNLLQGIAKRLVRAALQEAAKKKEMRYNDIAKLERGVRRHFHDDITVIVVYLDHHRVASSNRLKPAKVGGINAPTDIFSFNSNDSGGGLLHSFSWMCIGFRTSIQGPSSKFFNFHFLGIHFVLSVDYRDDERNKAVRSKGVGNIISGGRQNVWWWMCFDSIWLTSTYMHSNPTSLKLSSNQSSTRQVTNTLTPMEASTNLSSIPWHHRLMNAKKNEQPSEIKCRSYTSVTSSVRPHTKQRRCFELYLHFSRGMSSGFRELTLYIQSACSLFFHRCLEISSLHCLSLLPVVVDRLLYSLLALFQPRNECHIG